MHWKSLARCDKWPGSREAHVTNWPPLAVMAIGMWGYTSVQISSILVDIMLILYRKLTLCMLMMPSVVVDRNAEGCTPFMQAVCQRAYPAALYLLDTAKRIATGRERIDVVDTELLMSMLFPPGSSLDNSPLHILCCNDMCSFTWTGDEHINQVTCCV